MVRHPTRCVLLAMAALPVGAGATGVEISPTATVQYEWAWLDSTGRPHQSVQGFRRARLGLRLRSEDARWQLVIDHDLAARATGDAFVEWTPTDGQSFRLGQFKQPFTLEDALSDKQSAFPEPAPTGALAIGRRIGVEYARWGQRGTLRVALFGQRLDGSNDAPGASLRGTWLLRSDARGVAQLGFSLATAFPRDGRAGFGLSAGSALSDWKIAATGSLPGVSRVDRGAIEGLWIRGAWSAQTELAQVIVRQDARAVRGVAAGAQLTWSPTGDGRRYQRGVAAAPAPTRRVGWELALRWGWIDLDDGPVRGGQAQTWGLAASCYPHPNLRIIANVLHSRSERAGVSDSPLSAGLRLQLSY